MLITAVRIHYENCGPAVDLHADCVSQVSHKCDFRAVGRPSRGFIVERRMCKLSHRSPVGIDRVELKAPHCVTRSNVALVAKGQEEFCAVRRPLERANLRTYHPA